MGIIYLLSPSPIGILFIGGCIIIFGLLLSCVFRMVLNKEKSARVIWPCPMIVVSLL
jgi:hypothetical protein